MEQRPKEFSNLLFAVATLPGEVGISYTRMVITRQTSKDNQIWMLRVTSLLKKD